MSRGSNILQIIDKETNLFKSTISSHIDYNSTDDSWQLIHINSGSS